MSYDNDAGAEAPSNEGSSPAAATRRARLPSYAPWPNREINQLVSARQRVGEPRGPFVGHLTRDVPHPVYSFHPYHTKVPPSVIGELIRHYTEPGDLVLDPFCGSGMTGVAARDIGRDAVLIDLSPAATFIASVNTTSHNWTAALTHLSSALEESENKWGWLYRTEDGLQANYFVWSDVFACPQCDEVFPFFPHGVVHSGTKVQTRRAFPCPACAAELNVRRVNRRIAAGRKSKELVWVNAGRGRERVNRPPTPDEVRLAEQAEQTEPESWYPTDRIDPAGYSAKLAQLGDKQVSDVSRLLSRRNLIVYADLWDRLERIEDTALRNLCLATLTGIFTVVSERQGYFGGGGGMSGNLYMPIVRMEKNVHGVLRRKLARLVDAEKHKRIGQGTVHVSTQSATDVGALPDNSIDYVYTDPPFGANIIYSEVNLAQEAWLGVRTDPEQEAVIDTSRGRDGEDYGRLMAAAFRECHRVLRPGHWITVEFHNTNADIWNILQTALLDAGFVVGAVSTLDKGSTTVLGDIRPNSAKHDLLINAYKPLLPAAGALTEAPRLDALTDLIDTLLAEVPQNRPDQARHHVFSRLVARHIEQGQRVAFSTRDLYAHLDARLGAPTYQVHPSHDDDAAGASGAGAVYRDNTLF